jgi:hypothetical protein
MVKESDDQSSIAFTPSGCETWVDIPVSMIERAEHAGHRRCDDHSHPVFRITLKEAKSDQAKVFSALLASIPQQRAGAGPRPTPTPRRVASWRAEGRRSAVGVTAPEVGGLVVRAAPRRGYAACFRSTEGMDFDDWVTLCALEYELCMAGCTILS